MSEFTYSLRTDRQTDRHEFFWTPTQKQQLQSSKLERRLTENVKEEQEQEVEEEEREFKNITACNINSSRPTCQSNRLELVDLVWDNPWEFFLHTLCHQQICSIVWLILRTLLSWLYLSEVIRCQALAQKYKYLLLGFCFLVQVDEKSQGILNIN